MSLREEIQDVIYMRMGGRERVSLPWTECQEATKEVLSKIEKRIDEIKKLNLTTDDYTFLSNFWRSCDIVKEYLLK